MGREGAETVAGDGDGAGATAAAESPLREPKEVSAGECAGRFSALAKILAAALMREILGIRCCADHFV